MNEPMVATTKIEYWTEEECTVIVRRQGIVLLIALSVFIAAGIALRNGGGFAAMFNAPLLSIWGASQIRRRIRRGEKVEKPVAKPATERTRKRDRRIVQGVFLVLSLVLVWISIRQVWPVLVSPQTLLRWFAALYLQGAFLAGMGFLWLQGLAQTAAPQSATCPVAETVSATANAPLASAASAPEATHTGPRHWWTEAGTRAEVQEQRLGR